MSLSDLRSVCSWPSAYYDSVDHLIAKTDCRSLLEVGVAYGLHAEHVLNKFNSMHYVGIDPYVAGYDESDSFAADVHRSYSCVSPQKSMDNLYSEVSHSVHHSAPYRSQIIRSTLPEVSKLLPKGYFDFIFIDGDHTYDAVLEDLVHALPLLRDNGILAGDDFNWPDVQNAVTHFSNNYNLPIRLFTGSNGYKIWFYHNS